MRIEKIEHVYIEKLTSHFVSVQLTSKVITFPEIWKEPFSSGGRPTAYTDTGRVISRISVPIHPQFTNTDSDLAHRGIIGIKCYDNYPNVTRDKEIISTKTAGAYPWGERECEHYCRQGYWTE